MHTPGAMSLYLLSLKITYEHEMVGIFTTAPELKKMHILIMNITRLALRIDTGVMYNSSIDFFILKNNAHYQQKKS